VLLSDDKRDGHGLADLRQQRLELAGLRREARAGRLDRPRLAQRPCAASFPACDAVSRDERPT
jgi:hypothetical protein